MELGRVHQALKLFPRILSYRNWTSSFKRRMFVTTTVSQQQLKPNRDSILKQEVLRFNPKTPVESAVTPPSSWFTSTEFHELECETIFNKHWLFVGRRDAVQNPTEYFTGLIGNNPFIVLRDTNNELRAFFNVCRHHAMQVINDLEGKLDSEQLQCPYHGWTYALDGRLTKATRLRGIQNFSARNFGLKPMGVKTWGPLVLVNPFSESEDCNFFDDIMPLKESLDALGFSSGLRFVERKSYIMKCNWKVFVDNYLDGGYHVEIAHKDLGSALNLKSYETNVHDWHSVQRVSGLDNEDRVSGTAIYAHIFPNFMINRYGPWLDNNTVLPLGHDKCQVIFDYFLEEKFVKGLGEDEIKKFIQESFIASDKVQQEDIFLCEGVQRGLSSAAYDIGRYAPKVEHADHAFHVRLAEIYRNHLNIRDA
ncbi:uncharacterized protein [Ptychodera flava]|uniref:uncharacterized protein n=1 Tax=Ptychodera flava TaxID=63121 RepID=UPI00396A676D